MKKATVVVRINEHHNVRLDDVSPAHVALLAQVFRGSNDNPIVSLRVTGDLNQTDEAERAALVQKFGEGKVDALFGKLAKLPQTFEEVASLTKLKSEPQAEAKK